MENSTILLFMGLYYIYSICYTLGFIWGMNEEVKDNKTILLFSFIIMPFLKGLDTGFNNFLGDKPDTIVFTDDNP